MRILLANPNTTVAVTERIAAVGHAAASPGTEIVAVTGQTGVPYIATRAEAVIGARVALELLRSTPRAAMRRSSRRLPIRGWAVHGSCCPFPLSAWLKPPC